MTEIHDDSSLWTPDQGADLGDLATMNYADLVDSLRKDLQLDASTDLLTGSVLAALFDQNGRAPFVQLSPTEQVDMKRGGTTFNGAATNAINLTVVTGLPRAVSAFLSISSAGLAGGDWFLGNFGNTGTLGTITCTAYRPFGNFTVGTNNYGFNWIAVG